jgi:hypothetical protein
MLPLSWLLIAQGESARGRGRGIEVRIEKSRISLIYKIVYVITFTTIILMGLVGEGQGRHGYQNFFTA